MGTTPGSYPLTSDDLAGLDGISYPFTSDQLAARSDVPASFGSDDLLGLTDYIPMSTPSVSVTSVTKKGASLSGNYELQQEVSCSQPTGGTGNYTYTWEKVSGTTLTVSNGKTGTFFRTALGTDVTGTYRCRVSDGVSSVVSNNVSIRFIHYDVHEAYITNVTDSRTSGTARAGIYIRRDGTVDRRTGDTYTEQGDWVVPKHSTVGDDFEVYFNNQDSVSGDNSNVDAASPGLLAWGQISVDRYVREDLGSVGSEKAGVRIRIRLRGGVGENQQTYPIDKEILLSAIRSSPPPPPLPPPPPWSPPQVIN